jgi:NAD(P)H-dependent flavin oxidoreductase YrpB (nitropropane dioxygenase family)
MCEEFNRITDLLGIEIPVVQAPMGWIARSQLASAVSNAGGPGHHRDVVGRARRDPRRDPQDARRSPTSRSA